MPVAQATRMRCEQPLGTTGAADRTEVPRSRLPLWSRIACVRCCVPPAVLHRQPRPYGIRRDRWPMRLSGRSGKCRERRVMPGRKLQGWERASPDGTRSSGSRTPLRRCGATGRASAHQPQIRNAISAAAQDRPSATIPTQEASCTGPSRDPRKGGRFGRLRGMPAMLICAGGGGMRRSLSLGPR